MRCDRPRQYGLRVEYPHHEHPGMSRGSADVDPGAAGDVGFCFAENFSGDGGDLAFTEGEEAGIGVNGGDHPVRATLRAIRHRPSVPFESPAASTCCPATRSSRAYASVALPSRVPGSTAASSASASLTSAGISPFLAY